MRTQQIVLLTIITAMLFPSIVNAQEDSIVLIPPNTNQPTEIKIEIYISDILSIDEKLNIYEIDGFLLAEWTDTRNSFDPNEFGYSWKIYRNEMIDEVLTSEVWWPDLYLANSKGEREIVSSSLVIDPNGITTYEEKFKATIKQYFSLDSFDICV